MYITSKERCKLLHTTDIHLNFVHIEKLRSFCVKIAAEKPDAIVITGDISEAPQLFSDLTILRTEIKKSYPTPIFFVCGNHDYYYGSIVTMRKQLTEQLTYSEEDKKNHAPYVAWLGSSGIIPLTKTVCLIGHDGWYDAEYASFFKSNVQLWDYSIITELNLSWISKNDLVIQLKKLASEAAQYIEYNLEKAFDQFNHVFVATHVPPFKENAVYNGKVSDNNWLPHFSSKIMGDMLLKMANKYQNKQITVLCGHSHGFADNILLPNLRCITGEAKYKHPKINNVFEL